MPDRRKPVVLVILDGWGCAPPGAGNAVDLANTPVFDRLWAERPHTTIKASGEAVGLPPGQMGNSEVGHLTIGSGLTATPDQAREAHAFIKGLLDVPVLYGGSVKPENAEELLSQEGVDGALVGGAALDVESFTALCRIAADL